MTEDGQQWIFNMKVGDHIKHIDDNTGQGPNGAWTIEEIGIHTILFSDGCYAEQEWILEELENGNARLISNGELVQRYIEPHMVGGLTFNP